MSTSFRRAALALSVAAACAAAGVAQDRRVVCYVSVDFEHAESVLKAFTAKTGVLVDAVSDTEDAKTIGLSNRLIAEAPSPKADVFWNNECAQTLRLKAHGVLAPYASPAAATIPAAFKDPEGYWTGFAARPRVLVYNTKLIAEADLPKRTADLAEARWKGKAVVARPLTGTTLAYAGVLAATLGAERSNAFWRALIANDVQWEKGNAHVMRQVADGVRPFGLTDIDDAYVGMSDGKPIRWTYLDQGADAPGALVIPNSVMLIRGARREAEAKALIDFLLAPETEEMLAAGSSAQMPLHPGVKRPAHVPGIDDLKTMPVDWAAAGREVEARFPELVALFEPKAEGASKLIAPVLLGLLAVLAAAGVVRQFRRRRTAAT